jgi:hypothetical protein
LVLFLVRDAFQFLWRRFSERHRSVPRHGWRTEVRRYKGQINDKVKSNVKGARLKKTGGHDPSIPHSGISG